MMRKSDSRIATRPPECATSEAGRVDYVDWLRLIAILGVFYVHATDPFNLMPFHIKNADMSLAITVSHGFLFPWGMPLFFLIAGAGSWLALRHRTPREYTRERFGRLLIPFFVGSLLLSPIQLYFEWSHKIQTGVVQGSFGQFVGGLPWGWNTRIFGVVGYHLWFLGFLSLYALVTLPLFRWLKGEAGQAFVSRLAGLCRRRGGLLVFILPLILIRLSLHPFFPYQHDWADFSYLLAFFTLGYLLFSDQRFLQAVRRDWAILLTVGVVAAGLLTAMTMTAAELDVEAPPRALFDFVWWAVVCVCSWCFTTFMVFIGMRFLDFSNKFLRYGNRALLPFFVVHQPVIIVVAYFVVQWQAGLWTKVAAVALGSFAISLGLYELVIKRVGLLRVAFGVKAGRADRVRIAADSRM